MDFFYRMGGDLANAGEELFKAAKEVTESASLYAQIAAEESKIREQYRIIGQMYYEESANSTERMELLSDTYREAFERVSVSKWKIDNAKEIIAKSKGAVCCPQCGASVAKSAAFCSKCGTKMKKE